MSLISATTSTIIHLVHPTWVKGVFSIIAVILSFFFGDIYVEALIANVVLWFIGGITNFMQLKVRNVEIDPHIFNGCIVRGLAYFLAIAASHMVDLTIPGSFVQYSMIGFVAGVQFIFIMGNLGRAGMPLPQKILNQVKKEHFEQADDQVKN